MSSLNDKDQATLGQLTAPEKSSAPIQEHLPPEKAPEKKQPLSVIQTEGHSVSLEPHSTEPSEPQKSESQIAPPSGSEARPFERPKGARGTAAMDPKTRQEVARKGGLAVSRNRAHMAEIGRKGGMSVSKNRAHMAEIGRKGGAASRGHR